MPLVEFSITGFGFAEHHLSSAQRSTVRRIAERLVAGDDEVPRLREATKVEVTGHAIGTRNLESHANRRADAVLAELRGALSSLGASNAGLTKLKRGKPVTKHSSGRASIGDRQVLIAVHHRRGGSAGIIVRPGKPVLAERVELSCLKDGVKASRCSFMNVRTGAEVVERKRFENCITIGFGVSPLSKYWDDLDSVHFLQFLLVRIGVGAPKQPALNNVAELERKGRLCSTLREDLQKFVPQWMAGKIKVGGRMLDLTTDRTKPSWYIDPGKRGKLFYDEAGITIRDDSDEARQVAIVDRPIGSGRRDAERFMDHQKKWYGQVTMAFMTFLLLPENGQLRARFVVEWEVTQRFAKVPDEESGRFDLATCDLEYTVSESRSKRVSKLPEAFRTIARAHSPAKTDRIE